MLTSVVPEFPSFTWIRTLLEVKANSTPKYKQETKTFTLSGEIGMANESTKTTQTSAWMVHYE